MLLLLFIFMCANAVELDDEGKEEMIFSKSKTMSQVNGDAGAVYGNIIFMRLHKIDWDGLFPENVKEKKELDELTLKDIIKSIGNSLFGMAHNVESGLVGKNELKLRSYEDDSSDLNICSVYTSRFKEDDEVVEGRQQFIILTKSSTSQNGRHYVTVHIENREITVVNRDNPVVGKAKKKGKTNGKAIIITQTRDGNGSD